MPSEHSARPNPLTPTPAGLRVALRVQPGARRTGIDGIKTLDDGKMVLALRVSAPAEGGKANAAAVKLLAKAWNVPKSVIKIVAGHGGRRKTVLIAGDAVALQARLQAWLAETPDFNKQ
ncbi:MAG: DUF167 family protein [Alphaproteobacteria bacterium]